MNKLFRNDIESTLNACVGFNGQISDIDYANGFFEATKQLLDNATDQNNTDINIDEIIYSICFNLRHAVELTIKTYYEKLNLLYKKKIKTVDEIKYEFTHDLNKLWSGFKDYTISFDKRYNEYVTSIEHFISALSMIDSSGETFRYVKDQSSNQHLAQQKLISLEVLNQDFVELKKLLDQLSEFNDYLILEYSQMTFLDHLSRKDIFDIAVYVPLYEKWNHSDFNEIKKRTKEKFGISSNRQLSRILGIIKKNYETAPLIGIDISLKGISDSNLYDFFYDSFLLFNKNKSNQSNSYDIEFIGVDIHTTLKTQSKFFDILKTMGRQDLAGLSALIDFSSSQYVFSEQYIKLYEDFERVYSNCYIEDIQGDFLKSFNSNTLNKILKSLIKLNKIKLITKISSNLQVCTSFILISLEKMNLNKKNYFSGHLPSINDLLIAK